jgi:hypothetical protein
MHGTVYGVMRKTTLYLPDELKTELERWAAETGRSEAELVRESLRQALTRRAPPPPTIPIFVSDDPHFAERVDEYLARFGER